MEFCEENEKSANFLVPEMVRRSKTLTHVATRGKVVTPQVNKVYESKKRCLTKLKEHHKLLIDNIGALKQKGKSASLKQNAMMGHMVQTLQRGDYLRRSNMDLDEEHAMLIDDYENTMQKIDTNFVFSFKNYSDNNLRLLIEQAKQQLVEVQEQDCEGPETASTDDLPLENLLDVIIIKSETEKYYGRIMEERKRLDELVAELNTKVQRVEADAQKLGITA